MRFFLSTLLIISFSFSSKGIALDSVIFSEQGDRVLIFESEAYKQYNCMEQWSIYQTGDNNKQANLLVSEDSVYFYEYIDSGIVCPSLLISCKFYDYCVYRSMALNNFLEEYKFNQVGKRIEHKVTVELEFKDEGAPRKVNHKCYDLLESKGSFTYQILLDGLVYYSRPTAIDFTHIGFKNQYTTYADFKKKIKKEIKKDRNLFLVHWIAPNSRSEYFYFEIAYYMNYRIDCEIESASTTKTLIIDGQFSDDHRILSKKE